MPTTVPPFLGNWYQDLETQQNFQVVAVDDHSETVELQYLGGELTEFDLDSWYNSEFDPIEPPEDWSAPFDELEIDDLGYADGDFSSLKKRETDLLNLLENY